MKWCHLIPKKRNVNGNDKSLGVANKNKEIEQQSIDNDRIEETEESSKVTSKIERTNESLNDVNKISDKGLDYGKYFEWEMVHQIIVK